MPNIAADLVARISADTAAATRGITGFASGLLDLGAKAGLAVIGVGALFDAGSNLVQGLLAGAGEMERYQTQLTTLMGSADDAKDRLTALAKFGADTPFELPELVRAEKVLQGFGLTGQKAFEVTGMEYDKFFSRIGDIAAGVGKPFEEVALNFAKFSSGATGEAISRFQELGIATREQMAELGIQFDKSGALLSPMPEAMQAIMTLTASKFDGGMKALSETFEGRVSTLSDAWGGLQRSFGTPLLAVAGPAVQGLSDLLGNPAIVQGAESLGEGIGKGIEFIVTQAGRLRPALDPLVPVFQVISDSAETFRQALAGEWVDAEGINPFTASIGSLGSSLRNDVLPAAIEFGDWFSNVAEPRIAPVAAAITALASGGLATLGTGFQTVMRSAGPLADVFLTQLRPAMGQVGSFIDGTIVPGLTKLWEVVGPRLMPAVEHMGQAFGNLFTQLGALGPDVMALGGAFGELGTALLPVAAVVGGVLIAGLIASWEVISGLLTGVPIVIRGVVQGVTQVVSGLADVIGGVVDVITGILTGNWAGAWGGAERIVEGFAGVITGVTTAAVGVVVGAIVGMASSLLNVLAQLNPDAAEKMMQVKDAIVNAFQSLDLGAMMRAQMDNLIAGITGKISGVGDALGQLRGLFPSSPARFGPWATLPEWGSAFGTMPDALNNVQTLAFGGLADLRAQFSEAMSTIDVRQSLGAGAAGLALAGATALGGVSPAAAANPAKPARTMPETITITVPIELNGNSFGIGPNGTMAPEDMKRLAELLAPAVLEKVLEAIGADDEEGE